MEFNMQIKSWFQNIITSVQQLPNEVKLFLKKVVALFIVWKLLYILVLIPNEVPDAWMVKKLGAATVTFLNVYYQTDVFSNSSVTRKKLYGKDVVPITYSTINYNKTKKILGIYQACDGLELIILYCGFIICFSGNWKRKIVFMILGTLGLFGINIIRSGILGVISLEYPIHFEFAHKYFFNLVVYGFTFFLWMLYISKAKLKQA
jgi:exosortase/archaeosortase family protein